MNKEKFDYLYSFKYKNKDYIYLISENYPLYFLEYNYNTNNFDYPDIDIYKEIYNLFYSNDHILSFNLKELSTIKEILQKVKVNINPLVKTTSGLLSLAIVLSMCGCSQVSKKEQTTEPSSIVETQGKDEEIYNYFKKYNMDIIHKEYDGNDYIFVRDFINSNNKHQVTLQDFNEFRKYKNIDFIPTWNDVIEAFKSNENIDSDKKAIILECLNNMKNSEELKDLDLSVLYVNAKRMKFEYLSTEEMTNKVNRESVYAYFDTTTGVVYLPNDKPLEKFEFIHEVLGHGTLAYREENENTLMVFDCTNYIMLPTDDRYTGQSLGIMVSEGGANLIAHLATNDYSVDNFYQLYEEELRVIAKLCNVSLGELLNHKGISMYDLMYQNRINTPVEYIFKMDAIYRGEMYCEFSDLMERLFVDATEEAFMDANNAKQEEIISKTIGIIKDSYFKGKGGLHFNYSGGSIDYDFDESATRYEDNMNHLKSSK